MIEGRAPRETGRSARWTAWGLLAGSALAVVLLFGDYGVTWDEAVQAYYGELALDYFLSAGGDARVHGFLDLRFYGPLFETLLAIAARLVGSHSFELRHLLTAVAAWMTVAATGCIGRRFGEPLVAPFAMLALIAMPRFVGHAFNNSKDIPLACAFAWAVLAAVKLLESKERRAMPILLLALAAGSAMAIRSGALMLFAIVGAAAFVHRLQTEAGIARRARAVAFDAARLGAALLLAWGLMVLCWPWAHASPLLRPIAALAEAGDFSFQYTVLFAGTPTASGSLPHSYLPHYLAIVTPPATLLLAGVGLLLTARSGFRARSGESNLAYLVVLCWLGLPLSWVVLARPNVYDGIRHFLFLLPALALGCGVAAAWILRRVTAKLGAATAIALTLLLASPLVSSVRLHPYQSSYFNLLVGGVAGAAGHYDVDYWASSYREASLWVRAQLDQPATIAVACNGHNRATAAYYLEQGGERAPLRVLCVWDGSERLPADVRYFIGMRRHGKATAFYPDWPVVHRIERDGAWFSLIKANPRFKDGGTAP